MKTLAFKILVLFVCLASVLGAQVANAETDKTKPVAKWTYPGARDEEDIVVQTELVPPVEKIDRDTQAETVRNNLFKKGDKETKTQE